MRAAVDTISITCSESLPVLDRDHYLIDFAVLKLQKPLERERLLLLGLDGALGGGHFAGFRGGQEGSGVDLGVEVSIEVAAPEPRVVLLEVGPFPRVISPHHDAAACE